ncbi:MAG: ABC transporter permease [Candidatus Rokuibacteriota bacterium]|nr:MAG: ABC transporter permease [Candidatus Rokubacteria bacterium]
MPATAEGVPVVPESVRGGDARAWARRLGRIRESKPALIGVGIIVFWVAAAALAPAIAPYPPNANDMAALAHPTPSAAHWLGTDHLGRDIYSRIVHGARVSLIVGVASTLLGSVLGGIIGLLSGYAALNIIGVLTLTKAPIIARIVRGLTIELREREYVAAAKMRGESPLYIMLVEILPNARGPLIVDMCLRTGYNVVIIGALGFLGIGLPPPDPDWGGMVKDTYGMMSVWPHMALFPCAAISSLVIGFNLLAVGLREIGLRD